MYDSFEDNERDLNANESRFQTGEDDNARIDEERRTGDNLLQRDDIIMADDKFHRNEEQLNERKNKSQTTEDVDDEENKFAGNDEDGKICECLPKREDEILKDDKFHQNEEQLNERENKSQTREDVDDEQNEVTGSDEDRRTDDNLPQRDDIIMTDDEFDRNEEQLHERKNKSQTKEDVDDERNKFTGNDEDGRICESLPKREDEILKDDKFRQSENEFCGRGSRSEIEDVSDSSASFAKKNEEGAENNLPENEDDEARDDKTVDESENRYQNGKEADDAQNIFTETDEDIRLHSIFSENTGDDNFDDKDDLITGNNNLETQREIYYRQDDISESDIKNKVSNSVKFTVESGYDKRFYKMISKQNKIISKQNKNKSPKNKIHKYFGQENSKPKKIDSQVTESSSEFQLVTYDLEIKWDLCTTISAFFRLIGYVGDLVSDLVVCYFWFHNGHPLWFVLSLFFTLVPTIILNWISYVDMSSQRIMKNLVVRKEQKPWRWKITVVSHFFLLGPFVRYLNNFLLMFRFRNKAIKFKNINAEDKVLYEIMLKVDDSRIFMMTFTEAFMESAPQLILQIYTMSLITDNTANKTRVIAQVASMFFSLFMLSWSATQFHHTKKMISERNILGCVFNFLWYVCSIASRMLSIALFATIFPVACLVICCCHIAVVSSWILYRRYVRKKYQVLPMFKIKYSGNFLYILFIGVIYIFCYCELGTVRTRYRLLIYYLVIGVENILFINLWFEYVQNPHHWLNTLGFVAVFVCFVLGIVFMIIYYRFFHFNILNHPQRWKIKILFPEKQKKNEKKEEEGDPEWRKMKIPFQEMKMDDEKEDEEDEIERSYVIVDSPVY